jgi:hypothetical protein
VDPIKAGDQTRATGEDSYDKREDTEQPGET